MDSKNVSLRSLSLEELRGVVDWAANEGWNPGLADAEAFSAADCQDAFIGAFDGGRLLGAISSVLYGREFAFIGLFIVRPELRGGRLGPLLAKAAMKRAKGVNCGVDGVEAKIKNYEKLGFEYAHGNIRFEGFAPKAPRGETADAVDASKVDFQKLSDYDAKHFPARRESFLKAWIGAPGHRALAIQGEQGELTGFAVARPCRRGFKIGPLFASGAEEAQGLLNALSQSFPEGAPFYLDVPESNASALALAKELGMKAVFKTARMYSRFRPELPEKEIFGISSFELG